MADAVINGKVQPKQPSNKQWRTCAFIGSVTEDVKKILIFIGGQANKTLPTTGQNITPPHTTST
jgi:hypothetical protein